MQYTIFFFNCFWWNRSPYCLHFPLPSLRGQPTAKCQPRWQPISGKQSTVGWGDCWIRTQDCSFTIWCHYQWATTAPKWATTAPFFCFCFFLVLFASVGLVVHEFGWDPAYRVFIYSRMDLHFWGCQAGIRTRDRLTAVRHANLSATPHPLTQS